MIKLEDTIYGKGLMKGYVFKKYITSPTVYIYRVFTPFNTVCYYVFKRKKRMDKSGVSTVEYEWFPNNESFGEWAWQLETKERALEKFNKVINKYKEEEK
jgi:hypothetical protein